MDQNQSVDNDLQKAIDNITNTTNVDPVFSDPVAAPSSVPEGDTGEISEPVGPFPDANVGVVTPAPEPIAPLESMNIPEFNNPNLMPPAETSAAPAEAPVIPEAPAPTVPESPAMPEAPTITGAPAPTPSNLPPLSQTPAEVAPEPAPVVNEAPAVEEVATEAVSETLDTDQIKKAALRDLVPILDKVDSVDAPQKFKIYQDVFEDLKDSSVLEPAYKTAREIEDETARAEALLYLVESIDNM